MRHIGIIGAMEEEVAILKEKMTDVTVEKKASMEFYSGRLNGKEAVIVRSGNWQGKRGNLYPDSGG